MSRIYPTASVRDSELTIKINHLTVNIGDEERHHEHHHRHHTRPYLVVQGVAVQLIPGRTIHMATSVTIGHTVTYGIAFLDAAGNPMLVTPTPDSVPTWTQDTPATESLSISADGLTVVGTVLAVGTDNLNLSVSVGGVVFSATNLLTVTGAAQVLTSVAITSVVS